MFNMLDVLCGIVAASMLWFVIATLVFFFWPIKPGTEPLRLVWVQAEFDTPGGTVHATFPIGYEELYRHLTSPNAYSRWVVQYSDEGVKHATNHDSSGRN